MQPAGWSVVFSVRGWDDVIRLCRRDRTLAISSAVDVTKIVPLFAVNVVPLSYRGRLRHLMPCKEEATKWLRKVGQAQYFIPIALLSGERGHVVQEKIFRIPKSHCLWSACFPAFEAQQARSLVTWTNSCPLKTPCLGRDEDPALLWL